MRESRNRLTLPVLHCVGCVRGLESRAHAEPRFSPFVEGPVNTGADAISEPLNSAGESYSIDIVLLTVQQSGLASLKDASLPAVLGAKLAVLDALGVLGACQAALRELSDWWWPRDRWLKDRWLGERGSVVVDASPFCVRRNDLVDELLDWLTSTDRDGESRRREP